MYESERDHRRQQYGGHYYGEAMEGATQRSQTRRYCHPVRPISIDPEWVFGLETNLEGFSQADEHALPPNYKPFEVLFQQPGPTTFKFRDEVFFNSRSGERYFMNRLWHNHPPLEVEKTYSVVPGYSPPPSTSTTTWTALLSTIPPSKLSRGPGRKSTPCNPSSGSASSRENT